MRKPSRRTRRHAARIEDRLAVWACQTMDQALNHIMKARTRRRLTREEKDIMIYAENSQRADVHANAKRVAAMHPKTIGRKAFQFKP